MLDRCTRVKRARGLVLDVNQRDRPGPGIAGGDDQLLARHDDEILGTDKATYELHVSQGVASRRLPGSCSLQEPDGQRHA